MEEKNVEPTPTEAAVAALKAILDDPATPAVERRKAATALLKFEGKRILKQPKPLPPLPTVGGVQAKLRRLERRLRIR